MGQYQFPTPEWAEVSEEGGEDSVWGTGWDRVGTEVFSQSAVLVCGRCILIGRLEQCFSTGLTSGPTFVLWCCAGGVSDWLVGSM